jgi:hypothetical protein
MTDVGECCLVMVTSSTNIEVGNLDMTGTRLVEVLVFGARVDHKS